LRPRGSVLKVGSEVVWEQGVTGEKILLKNGAFPKGGMSVIRKTAMQVVEGQGVRERAAISVGYLCTLSRDSEMGRGAILDFGFRILDFRFWIVGTGDCAGFMRMATGTLCPASVVRPRYNT
jgi:hypothetical protein